MESIVLVLLMRMMMRSERTVLVSLMRLMRVETTVSVLLRRMRLESTGLVLMRMMMSAAVTFLTFQSGLLAPCLCQQQQTGASVDQKIDSQHWTLSTSRQITTHRSTV